MHRAAERVLAGVRVAEVVGEALVPFGPTDPGPLLDLVRPQPGPTPSCSAWSAATWSLFNREFARAGLDRRVVRLSGALEENGLYALGGDATGELYATHALVRRRSDVGADERPARAAGAARAAVRRRARRWSAPTPAASTTASGWPRALLGGRGPQRAGAAPPPRLARADGLAFTELAAG